MNARILWPSMALALLALSAPAPARGQDAEKETPRYALIPHYSKGAAWRVIKVFRQMTVLDQPVGRFGNANKNLNFSDFDMYSDIEALVTVDEVDSSGAASVWSVHFDRFRFDVPNPLETEEYQALRAERKRMGKPRDSHPIEGETVKLERDGEKERIFKVLRDGRDYGITNRYPELVGVMESLVKPDWTPPSPVAMGATWESDISSTMKLMKVVMRAPLEGKLVSRLTSVEDNRATVLLSAKLAEEFRRVRMELDVKGRVEFDLASRRHVRTELSGDVVIYSKTSSTRGTGKIEGRTEILPVALTEE